LASIPAGLSAALADRYRIERELGRGGMATVYLAHDLKHDRPVALKLLHQELAAVLGPERFQREIKLAARLQHSHILTVLDSGEAGGQLWFTMPFVDGESLRDRLSRERQLPLEDAVRIAREAAQALEYAHQHGVIHRDIKPENLLLARDGSTLVADFGVARALGGGDRMTETGLAVGTPTYMSPEQAAGEETLDARTDIYSLGSVLYEMIAGEPPFTGPTAQAVVARRMTETPRPVGATRERVPAALEEALRRALARAPADRFPSAAEFGRALAAVRHSVSAQVEAVAPGPVAARRSFLSRPLVTVFGLGLVVGLGVLFAWTQHRRAPSAGEAKRLAVLPFENVGDTTGDYFADGVTDEVRGKLSALPGLTVIASRSSSEYKHTTKGLTEIARELGVDYLLIGKIRWARELDGKSRVRVSPELVVVAGGGAATTRWQDAFDADLTDVFQVQADIAGKVAGALDLALGASQKQVIAARPTANLAAYDLYLRGEAVSQGIGVLDPNSLRQASEFYRQAVGLDSTFVLAWAQAARADAWAYGTGTPDPVIGERAGQAAKRAARLEPGSPEAQLALGNYYQLVKGEQDRALAAYRAGLQAAPESADLLTGTALVEQSLGRWTEALAHLEQARALDPRSVLTARRLTLTLGWLRRYPEAVAAGDRGLALAPTNPGLISVRLLVPLAQGDTTGARAVLRTASARADSVGLAVYLAVYGDYGWVLDRAQQDLLLRISPAAYADDRATWAIVRSQIYWLRGASAQAAVYADSARLVFQKNIAATPGNAQQHALLGLCLALMGRKADAIREGRRALQLLPVSKDAFGGPYIQHQLGRIFALTGEPEQAIDQLEPLLRIPYSLSSGMLRIDPNFASLRGNPRFEKLLAGS
jgi:eukaryotic-like serine/threonine-protein kinase